MTGVNLEADITAKYLEQLTSGYLKAATQKDARIGGDA